MSHDMKRLKNYTNKYFKSRCIKWQLSLTAFTRFFKHLINWQFIRKKIWIFLCASWAFVCVTNVTSGRLLPPPRRPHEYFPTKNCFADFTTNTLNLEVLLCHHPWKKRIHLHTLYIFGRYKSPPPLGYYNSPPPWFLQPPLPLATPVGIFRYFSKMFWMFLIATTIYVEDFFCPGIKYSF